MTVTRLSESRRLRIDRYPSIQSSSTATCALYGQFPHPRDPCVLDPHGSAIGDPGLINDASGERSIPRGRAVVGPSTTRPRRPFAPRSATDLALSSSICATSAKVYDRNLAL